MKIKIQTIKSTHKESEIISEEHIEKGFAIVDEFARQKETVWFRKLTGERFAPMYVESEILHKLEIGMLVTYENYYRVGDMGENFKFGFVDIDRLESGYFQ